MVRKFLLNGTKVRFIDDYKQKKRLNAELSQRQYAEDNKIHHTQLYRWLQQEEKLRSSDPLSHSLHPGQKRQGNHLEL
jgi:phage antirepressor YoqD-like protein